MKQRLLKQVRGKGTRSDGGRSLETFDAKTGEVLEGAFVFVPQKKNSPFGQEWFAMSQNAMTFLAKNRKALGEEGFGVLMALGARLDFENFILISQADLARDLGMRPQNLSRAIRRLEELGIIDKGPKSGRSPTFRMNPHMGWKGKAKHHFTALQEAQKRGWRLIEGDEVEAPDPRQPSLPFDV